MKKETTKLVVLQEFLNRHDAETIKSLLEENGIKSIVIADDCAGLRPQLSFGSTIKLKINTTELEKAREILKAFNIK